MVRAAVLVSGGGTNLQAILDAKAAGLIPSAELALVVSNKPDAFALERARRAGVATAVLPYAMGDDRHVYTRALTELLKQNAVELVVLAGFLLILTEEIVQAYPQRILNVHPSLIPSFCGKGFYGLRVHRAALDYGVKVTGATVHYVNEVADGGRIIAQKAVDVLPDDTPETLQKRVMEQCEWVILPRAVELAAQAIAKERTV